MNTQIFLDHFERLTDAPNAVARLRELVLQLAVQGKLVAQDESDEPAVRLLEHIEAERKRLVREKKIKEAKPLPPVSDDEAPYALPYGWLWTRLGSIGLINPRNDFDDDKQASFVPMSLVPQAYSDPLRTETRAWSEIKKGFTHFAEGDVVLAKITPCFQNGKAAVMRGLENGIGAGTTELLVFRPVGETILPEYVLLYLKSPNYKLAGEPRMTGTAGQKRLSNDFFAEHPFPLPPLEEQKRIVAKVDELMRLCDELERAQVTQREARQRLNRAALDQLLAARDTGEFQARWQMVSHHFPTLTATPNQIGELRQTVLQLAVQGKLTRQDPQDEPAPALLRRIRAERERLVKEKRLKRADPLPPVNPDETPFALPSGWTWVRLGELAETITKGSSPKWQGINYTDASIGVLFITSENVRNYILNVSEPKYVESKFNEIEPRSILKHNDILMNIVGASIGRTALYDLNEVANINQAVCLIRLVKPEVLISLDYMLHFFNSNTSINLMFDKQVDNARANLSMSNIAKFPIPFPPLEEQRRIVAAVNRLTALCDELEAGVHHAEEDGERLLRAAVRSLLAPTSENSAKETAELIVQ